MPADTMVPFPHLRSVPLLLTALWVFTAMPTSATASTANSNEGNVRELGLDNFATTLDSHAWTCVLIYDPFDERLTYEHSIVLEGLAERYFSNPKDEGSSLMAFGRLDLRRHAMLRDALTASVVPADGVDPVNSFAQDYFDKALHEPNDPLVMTPETLLNFQLGNVFWPATMVVVAPDFNVYAFVDLSLVTSSLPLRIVLLEKWLHHAIGDYDTYMDVEEPVFQTQSSLEKELRASADDLNDNSFPFFAYERDKRIAEREAKATEGQENVKKPTNIRLLLETDSKDDGKVANNQYFVYKKATVKKLKKANVYLDVLGVIMDEYNGWVEGYEVSWSPERKAREDKQTNFGFYFLQMNDQLRALVDRLFDPSSPSRQTPKVKQRLRRDKAFASRMAIPNLKGYFDEMVFGPGRSARSLKQVLAEITETMGKTAEDRRVHRSRYNGTEFPLVAPLRAYLGVIAEVEKDDQRFSLVLAELTSEWNNIMREFHMNLNKHYVTKYLEETPRPHGNNFQFHKMDIIDMKDPANHDMLSNYQDFHAKYTMTGTPVILSNVQMTREELTLESLVQQCAVSDVTKHIHISHKVGERQAGNGWGGLEEYVLDDTLLNSERKKNAKSQKTKNNKKTLKKKLPDDSEDDEEVSDGESNPDADDDEDDDEDDGIDRSLTMEQFAILAQRVDTLYLHDCSLPEKCDHLLFDHTPYDADQKFQIPSVIASYDLFQRLPHSSFGASWPSLFVGKKGSNSKLHIDSGATGFFMYLASGRKRWVVYNRDERVHVYERIDDASTYPDVLGIGRDEESDKFLSRRFPLLHRAEAAYEIIQEPGQLVYIPPNCPHAVENLEDIIGLAMNIVPREGIADHFHQQLHHSAEVADFDMAMNYLLFEDNADKPVATKDPLYTTYGEYKSQY